MTEHAFSFKDRNGTNIVNMLRPYAFNALKPDWKKVCRLPSDRNITCKLRFEAVSIKGPVALSRRYWSDFEGKVRWTISVEVLSDAGEADQIWSSLKNEIQRLVDSGLDKEQILAELVKQI